MLTTHECPVYCRYCTRKRKTLVHNKKTDIDIDLVNQYIKKNPKINEIIFSGGDPFMLPPKKLDDIVPSLLQHEQIQYIRYHTRAITTIPNYFTKNMLDTMQRWKELDHNKLHTIVAHINHPAELTQKSENIFNELQEIGYFIYSQSVLLRNINDNPQTLKKLFIKLRQSGIQPYYLHQLDQVEGSSHFHVNINEGIKIMQKLRKEIPPYLLPRYVQDSSQGKINLYY